MKKMICVLLALLLTGCAGAPAETEPVELSGSLTLRCQKGVVLVQCNGENLLVGCGIEARELEDMGVEALSAIVLTDSGENSEEHLDALLQQYPAEVWSPETLPEKSLWLDCARLTLMPAGENGGALALKVSFGEDTFLLAGTMTGEQQSALADAWKENLQADVLYIHGNPAEVQPLLDAVQPDSLITDGGTAEGIDGKPRVFTTDDYVCVTLETEGNGVEISSTFEVRFEVAS